MPAIVNCLVSCKYNTKYYLLPITDNLTQDMHQAPHLAGILVGAAAWAQQDIMAEPEQNDALRLPEVRKEARV